MNKTTLIEKIKALYTELHSKDAEIRANKIEAPTILQFKQSLVKFLVSQRINIATLEQMPKVEPKQPEKAKEAFKPELKEEQPLPTSMLATNSEAGKEKAKRTRKKHINDANSND